MLVGTERFPKGTRECLNERIGLGTPRANAKRDIGFRPFCRSGADQERPSDSARLGKDRQPLCFKVALYFSVLFSDEAQGRLLAFVHRDLLTSAKPRKHEYLGD